MTTVRASEMEPSPLPQASLAVVGVEHANADKSKSNRRFEIMLCKPGDPVELRPEPKNPADPQAVAVVSERGVQIGYLRAERAPRIRQLILAGREPRAVFQAAADFGAWIRIAFDGEAPVLPPARETGDPEPDWYPDEIYPDN
jgi:hypothetical protein